MRVCEMVFSVGFGPGLDSMSPARSRRSASHAAGCTTDFPKKLDTICTVPPDCGTPNTCRLYPFGARYSCQMNHQKMSEELYLHKI